MKEIEDLLSDPAVVLAGLNYEHQVELSDSIALVKEQHWFDSILFAERLGLSGVEFFNYLNGVNDMTLSELRMLATTVGLEIDYVVTYVPPGAL